MRRLIRGLVPAFVLLPALVARPALAAQEPLAVAGRGPQFLVSATTTSAPRPVDPASIATLQRRIAVSFNGVSIEQALTTIAKRAGLGLIYSKGIVPLESRVDFEASNVTVAAALTVVLLDANVDVWLMPSGKLVLVKRPEGLAVDSGTVVGRVTVQSSNDPIPGVEVVVEGLAARAVTDSSGEYRIAGVTAGERVIVARRIGYRGTRVTVVVRPNVTVRADISLPAMTVTLSEVVVTGPLTPTELRALPHPISVIKEDDIEKLHLTDLADIIRLMVPGAISTPPVGTHTSPEYTNINLRGTSNLQCPASTCSGVKIFVDGIQTSTNQYLSVRADQIERIEVVRGPEAAALYGADALGGVIQIITKRGRDVGARPEFELRTEIGRIESAYQSGGTLQQSYDLGVSGRTGRASYRLGAGYRRTGDWLPEYKHSSPSADAAVRFEHGDFDGDVMVRYTNSVTTPGSNPILGRALAGTPFETWFGAPGYTYEWQYNTYVARIGHQLSSEWRHELTAGVDKNGNEGLSYRPRLTSPQDTLLWYDLNASQKTSIGYRMSGTVQPSDAVSTTVTGGMDYYVMSTQTTNTGEATSVRPLRLASGAAPYLFANRYTVTGIYGRLQVGIAQSLFLTGSLRAERRLEDKADGGWPLAGTAGITYAHSFGSNTAKLRFAYGKTIRAPSSYQLLGSPQTSPAYVFLGNPGLRPEQQRGWDAGIDVAIGSTAGVSVTYYNQAARDFLYTQRISLPGEVPSQYQYSNVALVRNKGVELEGHLAFGMVTLRGNVTKTSSKPEELGFVSEFFALKEGQQFWGFPTKTGALIASLQPTGSTTLSAGLAHQGTYLDNDYIPYLTCVFTNDPTACASGDLDTGFFKDMPSITKLNVSIDQVVSRKLSLYLNVQDLTNRSNRFALNSQAAVQGRTISLGAKTTF